MYGHGFATLALAELYGQTRRRDLRDKLEKAVKLILSSQNEEGGWRLGVKAGDSGQATELLGSHAVLLL